MILGERPIIKRRFSGISYVDHRPVLTGKRDIPSSGSVQNLDGDELQLLAEGDRRRRTRKVYSEDEWRVSDVAEGLAGDHAVIDGDEYEVRSVEPLTDIIPHSKLILVGIQEGQ